MSSLLLLDCIADIPGSGEVIIGVRQQLEVLKASLPGVASRGVVDRSYLFFLSCELNIPRFSPPAANIFLGSV
jgi:hypothetical protein